MNARVLLLIALIAFPLAGHAQAFKCRTPSGKVEFSDSPCAGGSQTERIQSNEYISPERQRQAREVQARSAAQIQGIEAENAAFKQQQQQQQQHASQAAAAQRQAATDQQKALEMARAKSADANGRCIETATNRRNSAMLAECKGISKVQAQKELDDALTDNQPPPASNQQMPVIKNCIGDSCSDQFGQRYTTTSGKTVRSDGARCYQRGKVMYCD